MTKNIKTIIDAGPVIPVLVIEDIASAAPLAKALYRGGLTVFEVTLRTPVAVQAAQAMKAAAPDAIVGLGTICSPADLDRAVASGLEFGVSPGTSPALRTQLGQSDLPFLPGAASISEVMTLRDAGFKWLKFFPAEPSGGAGFLKSVHSVLPEIGFCPTGGISMANVSDYLALPNVRVVGGSWIAPADLIQAADWSEIENRAQIAARLNPNPI